MIVGGLHRHAALCRFRRMLKHPGRAALVLPPARPGSLGDEAMLRSALHALTNEGFTARAILTYDSADRYTDEVLVAHLQLSDWLSHRHQSGLMRFIRYAQNFTHFFVIGADVMDGYYSATETLTKCELINVAVQCGLRTTVLGFSMNASPRPDSVEALRAIPPRAKMYARDPVSHRRLVQLLGREIGSASDLAFLLNTNACRPEVQKFLGELRVLKEANRLLIGINVAYLVLGKEPTEDAVAKLIDHFRSALLNVAAVYSHATFVLVAHDFRGPVNDEILARRLGDGLHGTLQANQLVLAPRCLDSSEAKAVCSLLDAALTCRMHLGIACLSQGVPIGAVGYQDKFQGLMELFGLNNLLLDDSRAVHEDSLTSVLRTLITDAPRLKAQVGVCLPEVMRLAAKNFSG